MPNMQLRYDETPEILLTLAGSHATQLTKGHEKSEWFVKNKDGVQISTLPSKINETELFHILDLAKKYELEAFNIGINFGKKKTVEVYDKKIEKYQMIIEAQRAENERLANILDNMIGDKG